MAIKLGVRTILLFEILYNLYRITIERVIHLLPFKHKYF